MEVTMSSFRRLHGAVTIGVVIAGLSFAGCGASSSKMTPTTTPVSTAMQSTAAQYVGPPCSQMDATDAEGYSMCNSGGANCPSGWQSVADVSGACGPLAAAQSATTTTTTSPPTDYSSQYPLAFESSFDQSAVQAGATYSQASCMLKDIEQTVPYSTVLAVAHDIFTGNPPSWFTNAQQRCAGG